SPTRDHTSWTSVIPPLWCSDGGSAAVGRQRGTGDETRAGRGEEQYRDLPRLLDKRFHRVNVGRVSSDEARRWADARGSSGDQRGLVRQFHCELLNYPMCANATRRRCLPRDARDMTVPCGMPSSAAVSA